MEVVTTWAVREGQTGRLLTLDMGRYCMHHVPPLAAGSLPLPSTLSTLHRSLGRLVGIILLLPLCLPHSVFVGERFLFFFAQTHTISHIDKYVAAAYFTGWLI